MIPAFGWIYVNVETAFYRRFRSFLAGMRPESIWPFRLVAIGAAIQVLALLEILLLYYFDLRREALLISMVLFGCEALLMTLAQALGHSPAVGFPVACACAATTGFVLVRSRLRTLLADSFQSQPFGAAT